MTTPPRRWVSVFLWFAAVVLMLGIGSYQRHTGPTYPARGTVEANGKELTYALLRSATTGTDARIEFPDPGPEVTGILHWKRFGTADPWSSRTLVHRPGDFYTDLPSQPPAGKLEYWLELRTPTSNVRIPDDEAVVIRFKGDVPAAALIPHILFMFVGVVFGLRTGMEAIRNGPGIRWMAWTTFALLCVGGLALGPVVQLYAFGEAWTGVPFGWDLTDNKTLLMAVAWLAGTLGLGFRSRVGPWRRRILLAACAVMMAVYLIPHSMHGSTLDYSKVDQGVDPSEAIGQQ